MNRYALYLHRTQNVISGCIMRILKISVGAVRTDQYIRNSGRNLGRVLQLYYNILAICAKQNSRYIEVTESRISESLL